MEPFVTNGQFWRVIRSRPGDPFLIDRTGRERLATTDPISHEIHILESLKPPFLDYVLLHEIAHAVSTSSGFTQSLRSKIPEEYWIFVEEWAASLIENHALESVEIASKVLGRPVCIFGKCHD